jgi:hemerythrin-like domain-containing protein
MIQRHALTAHLANEHILIQKMLDLLKILGSDSSSNQGIRDLIFLISIFRTVLTDIHHHKEEDVLFPALLEQAPLNQGGPRCGHFVNHPLSEDAKRAFHAKAQSAKIPMPTLSPFVSHVFDLNMPLTIPLSEHFAGKNALELMEAELKNPSGNAHEFFLLASKFDLMMRLHIEKEDTCLFMIADRFISASQQMELLAELQGEDDGGKMASALLSLDELFKKVKLHG